MKRHLSTEQLSSYMDGEVEHAETREVEVHLAACPACRGRLSSMRRLVVEIRRLERPAPPADLGYQVRAQVAAQGEVRTLRRRARDLFRSLFVQPSFRAATAMGLGLATVLGFLAWQNVPPVPPLDGSRPSIVTVRTTFGEAPLGLPATTSEVAGIEFIWSGGRWVQKGLEWKTPETRVMVASPEGQAMINKYSDLMLLLTDGSRVVMQYRLATVELSKG
jgi:Putative zinc-finger